MGTRRELAYARVDGIIKDETFILMEIEAIEHHLWLEAKSGGEALEQLGRVFIPNGTPETSVLMRSCCTSSILIKMMIIRHNADGLGKCGHGLHLLPYNIRNLNCLLRR